jgi:hypothetical protein
MALIEFNDDVGGRHPWEVLKTQRSEVKTPYCKVALLSYVEWDRFVTLTGAQAEWGLRYRI